LLAILKDTSIYAIGDILTKGISFLAIVFYAHFLSQSDMGAYGYLLVIVGFVNTFLILGMDNAYSRYFFEYKSHYDRQVLTSTLFLFLILWIICILLLPIYFSSSLSYFIFETSTYSQAFFFSLLSLPLKLISTMSNQALRNQFKTKLYVVLNFITAFITVSGAILLLKYTSFGIGSIFMAIIIADVCVLPFRFFAIKEMFIKKIDFTLIKKILAYGIPFLPASVAYWIFSSADRVMLESMSSLESVGTYTVAVTLSAVMSIIAGAIGQAWSPHAVKAYEEDKERARELYRRFFLVLVSLALLIIFSISMLGKEIITLVFPAEYSNIFYPMLLLLSGVGFKITSQVTAIGISLAKKTIYLVYITFFVALVNIGLNYILIPIYAEVGASVATMVSYMLLTFIYTLISQKLFYINYNFKFIVLALFLLIIILILAQLNVFVRFSIFGIVLISIISKKNKIMEFVR